MTQKDEYNLGEALREFYRVEPLPDDFAEALAERVFAKPAAASTFLDWILLFALCAAVVGSTVYVITLLGSNFAATLVAAVVIAGLTALSVTEGRLLRGRILFHARAHRHSSSATEID
jgi:hypothetical protein